MANLISTDAFMNSGGAVFQSSGGNKCAVFATNSSTGLVAWQDIDGTPSKIGSNQSPATIHGSGVNLGWYRACIDSADVIHVVVGYTDTTLTRPVAYNTISDVDASPAWGTWELVAAHPDASDATHTSSDVAIGVDENDDPHVIFTTYIKTHGTLYYQVVYTEKTGASWTSLEIISENTQDEWVIAGRGLIVIDSNTAVACYFNESPSYVYWKSRASGTWGSASNYTTAFWNRLAPIIRTTGGTLYIPTHTSTTDDIYENDADTTYNGNTVFPLMDAYLDGTTRYIVYSDTGDDIHIISNDGGGWTDEGDLYVGTIENVFAGWTYNNLNNTTTIDILFEVGNNAYWEEFTLPGAVARRVFVTHIS